MFVKTAISTEIVHDAQPELKGVWTEQIHVLICQDLHCPPQPLCGTAGLMLDKEAFANLKK